MFVSVACGWRVEWDLNSNIVHSRLLVDFNSIYITTLHCPTISETVLRSGVWVLSRAAHTKVRYSNLYAPMTITMTHDPTIYLISREPSRLM